MVPMAVTSPAMVISHTLPRINPMCVSISASLFFFVGIPNIKRNGKKENYPVPWVLLLIRSIDCLPSKQFRSVDRPILYLQATLEEYAQYVSSPMSLRKICRSPLILLEANGRHNPPNHITNAFPTKISQRFGRVDVLLGGVGKNQRVVPEKVNLLNHE
jgi:hypothetical protein